MSSPDRLPVATTHVVYGPLSDGAVLFSTKDEVYFGLNQVGAQVWELLPPATRTLTELCAHLERRFEGTAPDVLRRDVAALLDDLLANDLVEYPDQERADAGTDPDTDRQADSPPTA
ncbi:MAG TPA: PqqD family protein [Gemmatimonadales bacterium]|nr:PqqD family protein [Gemmatimonadales bacterium]